MLTHSDPYFYLKNLQKEFANKVIKKNDFRQNIKYVCGIDVSYKNNFAFCSAVVINRKTLEILEIANTKTTINFPYISGLFMLRETKPILCTLKQVKYPFQLLLIDGHGILHPRRCGIACYIGLITNNPTIGIAKKLLCGTIQSGNFVKKNNDIIGYAIQKEDNVSKTIFVSIGNNISLLYSIQLVKTLTKKGELIPEPLRIADRITKNQLPI